MILWNLKRYYFLKSNLPAELAQNQIKSLRVTIFYRLNTEGFRNYAQNLDASDTEDRVCLGYSYQMFNVVWRSDMTFLFKNFKGSME